MTTFFKTTRPQQSTSIRSAQSSTLPMQTGAAQTGLDMSSLMNLMITMMIIGMMMKMMSGMMSGVGTPSQIT